MKEQFSLSLGQEKYGSVKSDSKKNKIEIKPYPSEILELSPEEQKKLKEKFAKSQTPNPYKKPERDPYADYGHGYVGIKKK